MTGAAAKQAVVELKKKNAALEKENAEMQKKIPSTIGSATGEEKSGAS